MMVKSPFNPKILKEQKNLSIKKRFGQTESYLDIQKQVKKKTKNIASETWAFLSGLRVNDIRQEMKWSSLVSVSVAVPFLQASVSDISMEMGHMGNLLERPSQGLQLESFFFSILRVGPGIIVLKTWETLMKG